MDPLTQGVLGATLPQAMSPGKQYVASAGMLGFFAGMAADLDVLIRSNSDPLLFLEYHRQFTHSLIFIPIGGYICALILHALMGKRRYLRFNHSWLFCTLGYATHALLDACTTYGTQLLWPFTDARIAWNIISIIDPLYTIPLTLGFVLSTRRRSAFIARLALAWALIYPLIGVLQRERAEAAGWELATQRGHMPMSLEAKPSIGNLILWKTVYATTDKYYIDAVRVGMGVTIYQGQSVAKLDIARDMPWLNPESQQARDLERFRWFSNGYIAKDPDHPYKVIDIRYSMIPNEIKALWSIELFPGAALDKHADYRTERNVNDGTLKTFLDMLSP
ncbi:MAG: inner membrane protein [Halieaceae bacterium]